MGNGLAVAVNLSPIEEAYMLRSTHIVKKTWLRKSRTDMNSNSVWWHFRTFLPVSEFLMI